MQELYAPKAKLYVQNNNVIKYVLLLFLILLFMGTCNVISNASSDFEVICSNVVQYENGRYYYIGEDYTTKKNVLYSMDNNKLNQKTVNTKPMSQFIIQDNVIYYVDDLGRLCCDEINGSVSPKILYDADIIAKFYLYEGIIIISGVYEAYEQLNTLIDKSGNIIGSYKGEVNFFGNRVFFTSLAGIKGFNIEIKEVDISFLYKTNNVYQPQFITYRNDKIYYYIPYYGFSIYCHDIKSNEVETFYTQDGGVDWSAGWPSIIWSNTVFGYVDEGDVLEDNGDILIYSSEPEPVLVSMNLDTRTFREPYFIDYINKSESFCGFKSGKAILFGAESKNSKKVYKEMDCRYNIKQANFYEDEYAKWKMNQEIIQHKIKLNGIFINGELWLVEPKHDEYINIYNDKGEIISKAKTEMNYGVINRDVVAAFYNLDKIANIIGDYKELENLNHPNPIDSREEQYFYYCISGTGDDKRDFYILEMENGQYKVKYRFNYFSAKPPQKVKYSDKAFYFLDNGSLVKYDVQKNELKIIRKAPANIYDYDIYHGWIYFIDNSEKNMVNLGTISKIDINGENYTKLTEESYQNTIAVSNAGNIYTIKYNPNYYSISFAPNYAQSKSTLVKLNNHGNYLEAYEFTLTDDFSMVGNSILAEGKRNQKYIIDLNSGNVTSFYSNGDIIHNGLALAVTETSYKWKLSYVDMQGEHFIENNTQAQGKQPTSPTVTPAPKTSVTTEPTPTPSQGESNRTPKGTVPGNDELIDHIKEAAGVASSANQSPTASPAPNAAELQTLEDVIHYCKEKEDNDAAYDLFTEWVITSAVYTDVIHSRESKTLNPKQINTVSINNIMKVFDIAGIKYEIINEKIHTWRRNGEEVKIFVDYNNSRICFYDIDNMPLPYEELKNLDTLLEENERTIDDIVNKSGVIDLSLYHEIIQKSNLDVDYIGDNESANEGNITDSEKEAPASVNIESEASTPSNRLLTNSYIKIVGLAGGVIVLVILLVLVIRKSLMHAKK